MSTYFRTRKVLALAALALFLMAPAPTARTVQEGPCHPGAELDVMPDGVRHDHLDNEQHRFECGIDLVKYDNLTQQVPEVTSFGELDVVGNLAAIAVAFQHGGFVLFDVTNPREPQALSRFIGPGCELPTSDCGTDVKISKDGRTVFVSTQPAQGSPPQPGKAGIIVADISDPRNPVFESFLPIDPQGVHMLAYHEIGGQGYVFAIHNGVGIHISKVGEVRGKTTLTRVANIDVAGQHDVFLYDDPVDGKTYLYLSGEMAGLIIFDVTNPAAGTKVGEWIPPTRRPNERWYTHNAWTFRSGGRRYTYVGPESVAAVPLNGLVPGEVWLLDTTDHTKPKLLGSWKNPSDRPGGNLGFSPHNATMVSEGVFWMAHYHGGVWLLDWNPVIKGASKRPLELGYYVPHSSNREVIKPQQLGPFYAALDFNRKPMIWDVVVKDDVAYASDINGGLYVLERASPDELDEDAEKRGSLAGTLSDPLLIGAAALASIVGIALLIVITARREGPPI